MTRIRSRLHLLIALLLAGAACATARQEQRSRQEPGTEVLRFWVFMRENAESVPGAEVLLLSSRGPTRTLGRTDGDGNFVVKKQELLAEGKTAVLFCFESWFQCAAVRLDDPGLAAHGYLQVEMASGQLVDRIQIAP